MYTHHICIIYIYTHMYSGYSYLIWSAHIESYKHTIYIYIYICIYIYIRTICGYKYKEGLKRNVIQLTFHQQCLKGVKGLHPWNGLWASKKSLEFCFQGQTSLVFWLLEAHLGIVKQRLGWNPIIDIFRHMYTIWWLNRPFSPRVIPRNCGSGARTTYLGPSWCLRNLWWYISAGIISSSFPTLKTLLWL